MRIRASVAFLFTLAASIGLGADGKPQPAAKGKSNRLAKESSPYLLQHAHNPVDWFPWGQVAFAKAKKENKLVFLSVGYSACHWCHVMERESFSNADVAKLLNEHFVCIKVDREERPDVDDVYMTALNVYGESGGWPLSMLLSPDGKPIGGFTYLPPDDFKAVLNKIQEIYTKDKAGLLKQADTIAERTVEALERNSRLVGLVPLTREMVTEARESYSIDPEHGGTGSKKAEFRGTKFPRVAVWLFLLEQSRKKGNEATAKAVQLTLRKMAEGGIYDQLGGGFHRYSTERTWTVPHFEKMLYDNAQLVELYSEAYRTDPNPLYKRVVAESLEFIRREMTSPEGAFYSALDADSNHKEGEFYVWTMDELKIVLGNDADVRLIKTVYGAAAPNFEGKSSILRLPKPIAEIAKDLKLTEAELLAKLEPLKAKLLTVRAKRERPFLDRKVITAWNGQMIAGYARAGEVFRQKGFTDAAAKAADFLWTTMRTKDGRLMRLYAAAPGEAPAPRGRGYLDDYAYFIHGLLTLHDATGDKKWLDRAKTLTDTALKLYADLDRGGFYFTAHDHEKLFARSKDAYDSAQPSGNGVMAHNLVRLGNKTGDRTYRDFGLRTVKVFAMTLRTSPGSMPSLALALDELLDIAAKDPTALAPPASPLASDPTKKSRESASVVKAELKAGAIADGKQSFTVTLTIEKPWHLYASPVGNATVKESETSVEVLIGGKKVEAAIVFPKGKLMKDPKEGDYRVYEGTVAITGTVSRGKDSGALEVRVSVNACKSGEKGVCLQQSVLKLK